MVQSNNKNIGTAPPGLALSVWWQQRLSAIAMVPLILWFVYSIIVLLGKSYDQVLLWFSSPFNATALVMFLVIFFHHAQLGICVIIEDYIHNFASKSSAIIITKLLSFVGMVLGIVSVFFVVARGL